MHWHISTRTIAGKPKGFVIYAGPGREPSDVICIVPRNGRTQGECEDLAREIADSHNRE